ncbi:hypothetical protein ACFMKC_19990, partial [Acinetobacter baumannii]|uniref:hypothetical protein n=1 Tax=Acinetobacter baumannii TaxID=470 RepID=UPI0037CA22AC
MSDRAQLPLTELADALAEDADGEPLQRLAETITAMFMRLHNDERQRGLIRVMMHLELLVTNDG